MKNNIKFIKGNNQHMMPMPELVRNEIGDRTDVVNNYREFVNIMIMLVGFYSIFIGFLILTN